MKKADCSRGARLGMVAVVLCSVMLAAGVSAVSASATPAPVTGGYGCPSADELGFALGVSDTSADPIFCSYPAVQGGDPNEFYCEYDATTGALVLDHDAGLCPARAAEAVLYYVPQTKDDCMQSGWQSLDDGNGAAFKNQGDCVSYVATGGRNQAAG